MSSRSKAHYIDIFAGITKAAMVRFVRDKVSPRARWIAAILILHRDFDRPKRAFPCPMREIRRLSGFGYSTIRDNLEELEQKNVAAIARKSGRQRNRNEYRLNVGYLGFLVD